MDGHLDPTPPFSMIELKWAHTIDMWVSLSLQWAVGPLMYNLGKNVESVLALVKMELTNCLTVLIHSTKSTLLPFKMAADAPCTVCSHRLTCWALFMWTKCVYNCLFIQIKVWSVAVQLEISTFCSGSQFFETWKSNWWAINLSRINSSQINSSRVKSTQLESN